MALARSGEVMHAWRQRRAAWLTRTIVLASLVVAVGSASAHPLDIGYAKVNHDGEQAKVSFELDVATAHAVVQGAPLDAAGVAARATELSDRLITSAPMTTAAGPCTWGTATAELADRTIKLTRVATCPAGARSWTFPFLRDPHIPRTFQLIFQEPSESDRITTIDATSDVIALAYGTGAHGDDPVGFIGFVWSGVEHIGAAPSQWRDPEDGGLTLPDGIDHILFVIALVLGGGTLWRLLGVVSGFTLGHSLTLALSALNVVRPSLDVIEPIIALSIAAAAVEAFIGGRFERHRWKIATGFGLVHGFGFAAALNHLQLSMGTKVVALFGYNLGVELGQVAIVILAAPLVLWLRKQGAWGLTAVRVIAALIAVLGFYWFVQRLVS